MSERFVVENNHLSPDKQKSRSEELTACGSDSSCKASVREHYAKEYENVAPLWGERHGSAVPMVFMP